MNEMNVKGEERLISSDNSKIKVYVVPTDEGTNDSKTNSRINKIINFEL